MVVGEVKLFSSGSGGSFFFVLMFSIVRFSFFVLQSEGLGLLYGGWQVEMYDDGQGGYEIYNYDGYKDEEDVDYVYVFGSFLKLKVLQWRLWLGSIRWVFEKGMLELLVMGGSREDLGSLGGQLEVGMGVDGGLVWRQGML